MSLQKREKLLEKEIRNPGGKGALGYDCSMLTMERQRQSPSGKPTLSSHPSGCLGLPEDKGSG